jgi:hypothetical protein
VSDIEIIYLKISARNYCPSNHTQSKPKAPPTPIKAIPTVALVVQELPVAIEIIEHIITVAGKIWQGSEFVSRNRSLKE